MPYEYLEDVATADIAFRAWGRELSEVFRASVDATMNVMVEELGSIRPVERREIEVENEALDLLLFDLLQEILFFKDAERLLLRLESVRLEEREGSYVLRAEARGEVLDPDRHETRVDVKAVTFHRFSLKETDAGWEATVILDI